MAELPNLKGVATQDLVESIGSGRFSASYINWSRTMQLFRENAPGWQVETLFAADGTLLHKAPVGGYLLLRLRHLDGSCTPEVPQAVMDNRNNAIPYEKITARDITDTQRRGACLVLAMQTGLRDKPICLPISMLLCPSIKRLYISSFTAGSMLTLSII